MELLDETRSITCRVEEETGTPIVLQPDERLTADATRSYQGDHHLIRYHPRGARFLDRVMAHEAGHAFRRWSEQPDRICLPAVTPETRKKALRDREPYYRELLVVSAEEAGNPAGGEVTFNASR